MNFLIVGSNGMAGHMIACYLKERGHSVIGFAREQSPVCETVCGDALDRESIRKAVGSQHFDYVVNCVGVLNRAVDANLPDGIFLNSVFPHELSNICRQSGARLIHLSSDCIFSGRHGGYLESDIPDETSYYGRTKWLGEVTGENELTFRTSIVGPEIKRDGVGLFHWFMSQNNYANGFTKVIWSGVTTLELAKAVEAAAKQKLSGLYHLCNNEGISKYDLLNLFNKYCRQNSIEIRPRYMPVSDHSLICTRDDFDFFVPGYEQMVQEMGEWMRSHGDLYQQYRGI